MTRHFGGNSRVADDSTPMGWGALDLGTQIAIVLLVCIIVLLVIGIGILLVRRHDVLDSILHPVTMDDVPGMKALPLKRGPVGPVIQFTTTSSEVCFAADLDMIKQELLASDQPKLLVSIESLTPGDTATFSPVIADVALSDLEKGLNITLTTPGVEQPTHLGLYLCKDSLGEHHCNGKEIASYENLHEVYNDNPGKRRRAAPGYKASDKIYFFAYLLVSSESLEVLDNQMPPEGYEKLRAYLTSNTESPPDQVEQVVTRVKSLNDAVKSASAEFHGSAVKLDLPHLDFKACSALKERLQKQNLIPPPQVEQSLK